MAVDTIFPVQRSFPSDRTTSAPCNGVSWTADEHGHAVNPRGKHLPVAHRAIHFADVRRRGKNLSWDPLDHRTRTPQPSPQADVDVPKPSNDPANRASSATQSSLLADVDALTSALPALTMCDDPAMFTNVTHSRAPPASNRESNNRTTKAHKVLDSIEKRVRTLLRSSPSSRRLHSDVEGIRRALHDVRRQVDSVTTRKRELTRLCDELEERVVPEEEDDDPMDYDSSHHFNLLIDDCNETAQVSLLLAAVSVLGWRIFPANGFPRPQLSIRPRWTMCGCTTQAYPSANS
ncbi:hypothetical protein EDD15DRAFT_2196528 [Pisolithus albus]|nr:hypothetical protein EDD15DRAFT_2196528 [Pisolithus albus]